MMQLRKICNHPYLFLKQNEYFPIDETVFRCSGKFELLDRIIPKLLHFKHRMLIFCQMTHVLDILEHFLEHH
jgi:SNF2 family DNA or RNA helicase